jgi:hypothetical protein
MEIVNNVPIFTPLLEHQHRVFAIVHETDAAINRMAERMKQIVQTAGKAPLDIQQRDIMGCKRADRIPDRLLLFPFL